MLRETSTVWVATRRPGWRGFPASKRARIFCSIAFRSRPVNLEWSSSLIAKSALCARISQEAPGEAPVTPVEPDCRRKTVSIHQAKCRHVLLPAGRNHRSEEHTSELQSL